MALLREILKQNKWLLLAQLLALALMIYAFVSFAPWLSASPIEKLALYDDPSPPPPLDARSFTIGRGHFTYYEDSPSDEPVKVMVAISSILLPWVFIIGSYFVYKRRVKSTDAWQVDSTSESVLCACTMLMLVCFMRIPTRGDWGVTDKDDIEAEYALNFFLGKSQKETWEMCV